MTQIKDYYRKITSTDIVAIAERLIPEQITDKSAEGVAVNCPNHQSQSGRSLHISPASQSWYCHGCGVGGDVLHLVEFIQSGTVTKGHSGMMPDSHRKARDTLAQINDLPSLNNLNLDPKQIARIERQQAQNEQAQEILTRLAHFYHHFLMEHPNLKKWVMDKYGFDEATLKALKIGFAPDSTGTRHFIDHFQGDTQRLIQSGAFIPTRDRRRCFPYYQKRVVFPYWNQGRVVFMIGRHTPWTEQNKFEMAKYKKLRTHCPKSRPYIAPGITNAFLYNEDVLLNRPKHLVITEGVTDCISLMSKGIPTISPVTVNIRKKDWERLASKLNGIETVYICQDNEISGAGLKGAMSTASVLKEVGIESRIITLPLEASHQKARETLAERFGIHPNTQAQDLKGQIAQNSPEDRAAIQALLGKAKIDVNEYFACGHSGQDFQALIERARTPLEWHIDALDPKHPNLDKQLEPILSEMTDASPLQRDTNLKRIKARLGKGFGLSTIKQQFQEVKRRTKQEPKKSITPENFGSDHSLKEHIAKTIAECRKYDHPIPWEDLAMRSIDWIKEKGGVFFHTPKGCPQLFWQGKTYHMESKHPYERRTYRAFMDDLTGIVPIGHGPSLYFEKILNAAMREGRKLRDLSWLHTDLSEHAVFFNLNNEAQEIVRITPEGVEVMPNGINDHAVLLSNSDKLHAINYDSEADINEAVRTIENLISRNLACDPKMRRMIPAWLMCFLLRGFSDTCPMLRLEGQSGSGKTTASKMLSTLLFKDQWQKVSTVAANYSDATRNPMVLLDNLEVANTTNDLITFLLLSVSGATREKRIIGTDSDTVIERPQALICSTGIEPLGGEYSEVQNRSLVVNFDRAFQRTARDGYHETTILHEIKESRDLIMSAIFKLTSRVLKMIAEGTAQKVRILLSETFGDHAKSRCNDYFALMYMMMLATESTAKQEQALATLAPLFHEAIDAFNATSLHAERNSNHIVTVMRAIFAHYQRLSDLANEPEGRLKVANFIERYPLRFINPYTIDRVRSQPLFAVLRKYARDHNLVFPLKSAHQFAQRLRNDSKTIEQEGLMITKEIGPARFGLYTIADEGA